MQSLLTVACYFRNWFGEHWLLYCLDNDGMLPPWLDIYLLGGDLCHIANMFSAIVLLERAWVAFSENADSSVALRRGLLQLLLLWVVAAAVLLLSPSWFLKSCSFKNSVVVFVLEFQRYRSFSLPLLDWLMIGLLQLLYNLLWVQQLEKLLYGPSHTPLKVVGQIKGTLSHRNKSAEQLIYVITNQDQ